MIPWYLAFFSLILGGGFPSPAVRDPITILVIPPENRTGDPDLEWIGEAVSEGLSRNLDAGSGVVFLRHPARRRLFQALGFSYPRSLTLPTSLWIGRAAGVDWVLTGGYRLNDQGAVNLHLRIYDPRGAHPPSPDLQAIWKEADPAATFEALARRVAGFFRTVAPSIRVRPDPWPDFTPSIFMQIIQSLYEQDPDARWRIFTEIVARDPGNPYLREHQVWTALEREDSGGVVGEALSRWLTQRRESESSIPFEDLFWVASWNYLEGRFDAALDALLELSRQRDTAALSNDIGVLLVLHGNLADAGYYFRRAGAQRPENWTLMWNQLIYFLMARNFSAAKRVSARLWAKSHAPEVLGIDRIGAELEGASGVEPWLSQWAGILASPETPEMESDLVRRLVWIYPLNPAWVAYDRPEFGVETAEGSDFRSGAEGEPGLTDTSGRFTLSFADLAFLLLKESCRGMSTCTESFFRAAEWLFTPEALDRLRLRRRIDEGECRDLWAWMPFLLFNPNSRSGSAPGWMQAETRCPFPAL